MLSEVQYKYYLAYFSLLLSTKVIFRNLYLILLLCCYIFQKEGNFIDILKQFIPLVILKGNTKDTMAYSLQKKIFNELSNHAQCSRELRMTMVNRWAEFVLQIFLLLEEVGSKTFLQTCDTTEQLSFLIILLSSFGNSYISIKSIHGKKHNSRSKPKTWCFMNGWL